ncbi:MAG: leucine-rich repeat protein [Caryophanon sp.]|nr:leucine-rich repeat protein [Caryophanon sp.]
MKKWMATFAAVAAVCAVAPQAEANETIVQDGVRYEIFTAANGEKEARVLSRTYGTWTVKLADTINGVPVTEIRSEAFVQYEWDGIDQSIEYYLVENIPVHLKKIEEGAFLEASFLDGVVIPETVEVIEANAFARTSMSTLVIPESVKNIANTAFKNIHVSESAQFPASLTKEQLTIRTSNPSFQLQRMGDVKEKRLGDIFYETFTSNNEQQVRITGYDTFSTTTTITVPETIDQLPVTEIAEGAFYNQQVHLQTYPSSEKQLTLPTTIRKVGDYALAGNIAVDVSTLPNLEEIGNHAFASSYVYSSKPLVLPATLHTIGADAFNGANIPELYIQKGTDIGAGAFANSQLQRVTIAEGVTAIAEKQFYNNELQHVTIPSTVQQIGAAAFAGNKLASVDMPQKLQYIGDFAFMDNALRDVHVPHVTGTIGTQIFDANGIQKVTFEEGITHIPAYFFQQQQLTDVTLPSTLTHIGEGAFQQNALTDIVLPANVVSIGHAAFNGNKLTNVHMRKNIDYGEHVYTNNALTNVTIEEGVTTIPKRLFMNNKIESITLPKTVTTIEEEAFSTNALTTLHIPASVATVTARSFARNELQDVTIEKASSIHKGAFLNNHIETLKLPANLQTIGEQAFAQNDLKRLVLPSNVKTVGTHAFLNNNIASVTVPASIEKFDLSTVNENPVTQLILQGSNTAIIRTNPFFNKQGATFKGLYTDAALQTPFALNEKNGKPQTLYVAWNKAPKFKDIAEHWAQGAIESFTDKGYINGYPDGTFKPGAPIQRKHVARILNDVFKFDATQTVADFTDVPKNHAYYAAISAVQQAGIFSGDNGKFQPEANLTRGQLAKVLVLAAGFEPGGKSTFKDTPVSYWGTPYIATLADLAIVKGTDGFFNPQKPITRAQFVSMTSLALEEMERRANN